MNHLCNMWEWVVCFTHQLPYPQGKIAPSIYCTRSWVSPWASTPAWRMTLYQVKHPSIIWIKQAKILLSIHQIFNFGEQWLERNKKDFTAKHIKPNCSLIWSLWLFKFDRVSAGRSMQLVDSASCAERAQLHISYKLCVCFGGTW
jgi:hypothetical protein